MLSLFKNHIEESLPFLKGSRLLIAISGGLDSVALTHLCHALKLDISLAHCNFNLRKNESNDDEAFVLDLAEQLNLEVFIQNFDTESYANKHKLSIQMAARELRYNWFDELSKQLDFDYILTAHHADDNLETVLINFLRGTGLEGLTGIPEVNDVIIRPMLKFPRVIIETYAKTQNFKWREDSSNASTKYLRNKLRHDVIPILKEINPTLLNNFENSLENFQDTVDIVQESVATVLKKTILSTDNNAIIYDVSQLTILNNPKAYLFEIFKDYGFTDWNVVVNLLKAQSGKQIISATHTLLKDRKTLILTENLIESNKSEIIINSIEDTIKIKNRVLSFNDVETVSKNTETEIFVDAQLLNFPLKVRHWEKGDYFYPFGMKGKKKLSKFFKDEKLSLRDKEKCLVLMSNNDIVWVINHRSSEHFKVTTDTNNILKITFQ